MVSMSRFGGRRWHIATPLLALCLVGVGCSATSRAPAYVDRAARRLVPPSGAGLLYVVRPAYRGRTFRFDLFVDGRWIGSTGGLRYVFTFLSPGFHLLESRAEGVATLRLQVAPGRTYYVEQQVVPGAAAPKNRLVLLPHRVGVRRLRSCYLSKDIPAWAIRFAAAVAAGPLSSGRAVPRPRPAVGAGSPAGADGPVEAEGPAGRAAPP